MGVSDIGKILRKGSNLIVKNQNERNRSNDQNLYALNTIYGWCIAGAINLQEARTSYKTNCKVSINKRLNETVILFWKREDIDFISGENKDELSVDDKYSIEIFNKIIKIVLFTVQYGALYLARCISHFFSHSFS